MRRLLARLALGAAIGMAAGCGGTAFQSGGGSDDASVDAFVADAPNDTASMDSGTGSDGANDAVVSDGQSMDVQSTDAQSTDAEPMDARIADVQPMEAQPIDAPAEASPPPHCGGGFSCALDAPPGWQGPQEVYFGQNPPPPCTANYGVVSFDGNSGLDAPPAVCNCTCQAAQGVQCAPLAISFANSTTCSSGGVAPCGSIKLAPNTCTAVDERTTCVGPLIDMSAGTLTTTGGSCTPQATTGIPPASWSTTARACLPAAPLAQADCAAGAVCAPVSASPYQSSLCVSQTGDIACPGSGYTSRHVFFDNYLDTRGCSTCTCGGVNGATCSGSLTVRNASAVGPCTGSPVTFGLPFTCDPAQQPGDFFLAAMPSGGTCNPSSVNPTGGALPTKGTTFCCIP